MINIIDVKISMRPIAEQQTSFYILLLRVASLALVYPMLFLFLYVLIHTSMLR